MKKIVNYILLSALMITFLPYSALAETTVVGVKVTGSASIEVVTTISADITVDLTTGKTTPTYMEIQNNSLVPVNAKITNISTTSEGAPTSFVKASDKEWNNLSKEDTKKYVNFNILGEGQDVKAQDILPDTEIDLGTLPSAIQGFGGETGFQTLVEVNGAVNNDTWAYLTIFELNANLGKNWDEGDKSFTYQIETVYSKADSNPINDTSLSTMEGNENIGISFLLFNEPKDFDSSKDYFGLSLTTSKESDEFYNQLTPNKFNIYVNGERANQVTFTKDDLIGVDYSHDGKTLTNYLIPFTISNLEESSEGKTHYLTINVQHLICSGSSCQEDTTFTFIKKVIAYSE